MNASRILLVEDNMSYAFLLENQLRDMGYELTLARSAQEALTSLKQRVPELIISDLIMPEMDGHELLRTVKEQGYDMPFIILTAHGSVESAVQAIKNGAFDYLKKDCTLDELTIVIKRALEFGRLTRHSKFREHVVKEHSFESIITNSAAMSSAIKAAGRVAASPGTTVAIYGESGVGKEVLAQAIHFAGGGLPSNFIAVNCASIPDTLMESELFGHVKGAFTGAYKETDGKFALAKGGTLLLDEIGDMPLSLQAKLLRVIEERSYYKIGSNRQLSVDLRVIAATHRDLEVLVKQEKFRADLFHRLNVFPIRIPPLRERKEDIPLLVDHLLPLFRQHLGKPLPGISSKGMDTLLAYDWPGNVRELRNCLERAAILVSDELIRPEHLVIATNIGPCLPSGTAGPLAFNPGDLSLGALVQVILEETLKKCGGNKTQAAQLLKINRKMFNRKGLAISGQD